MMANMVTSDKGIVALMMSEGIVIRRYKDVVGVWTIGVGVTAAAGADINPNTFTGIITISHAIEMFRHVLKSYEAEVNRLVKVELKQHQFDAMVSFEYNSGGLQYKNKRGQTRYAKILTHVNAGNFHAAHDAFMGWIKPKSLIKRREHEQRVFRNADYGNGIVAVWDADDHGRLRFKKKINGFDLISSKSFADHMSEDLQKPEMPGADKPVAKSKTFWGAVAGFVTTLVTAFAGLDWKVQLALIAVVCGGATWLIISERLKYRELARKWGL